LQIVGATRWEAPSPLCRIGDQTVREGFFPQGVTEYAVEPAGQRDGPDIAEITWSTERPEAERRSTADTPVSSITPDGHAWEVAHNPGFARDDDGSVVLPR
jgi:hypothetical protein